MPWPECRLSAGSRRDGSAAVGEPVACGSPISVRFPGNPNLTRPGFGRAPTASLRLSRNEAAVNRGARAASAWYCYHGNRRRRPLARSCPRPGSRGVPRRDEERPASPNPLRSNGRISGKESLHKCRVPPSMPANHSRRRRCPLCAGIDATVTSKSSAAKRTESKSPPGLLAAGQSPCNSSTP